MIYTHFFQDKSSLALISLIHRNLDGMGSRNDGFVVNVSHLESLNIFCQVILLFFVQKQKGIILSTKFS